MPPKITPKILPLSLVSHWQGVISIKARRKGRIQGRVEETDEAKGGKGAAKERRSEEDKQTVSENWAKSEKDRKTEGNTNGKKDLHGSLSRPQQTCRCDI